MDADGDMTFSYDGFGVDSSQTNVTQEEINALVEQVTYSQELLNFTYTDINGNPIEWGNVNPANYQSYFRLSINGETTANLLFDITNDASLVSTAATIQTALQNLTGDSGLTVTYQGGTPTQTTSAYAFLVTFSGTPVSVQSQPAITMLAPSGAVAALPAKMVATFVNPNYQGLGLDLAEWDAYLGLLSGDANAAMFTQYDPHATTVLSSDDIANATRDGQDTTYYLDVDPNAVSGGFVLTLSTPDDVGVYLDPAASIAVTPVFTKTGVDAVKTAKAIQDALAAATTYIGVNWPIHVFDGSVDVQLVWDPLLPGLATYSDVTGGRTTSPIYWARRGIRPRTASTADFWSTKSPSWAKCTTRGSTSALPAAP